MEDEIPKTITMPLETWVDSNGVTHQVLQRRVNADTPLTFKPFFQQQPFKFKEGEHAVQTTSALRNEDISDLKESVILLTKLATEQSAKIKELEERMNALDPEYGRF
jgi:hypothetical protein